VITEFFAALPEPAEGTVPVRAYTPRAGEYVVVNRAGPIRATFDEALEDVRAISATHERATVACLIVYELHLEG
jgi:hypothetical protein